VDQDITKPVAPDTTLTTEWKGDLLGGVMVIKGKFADGTPLIAVPNYARTNRDPAEPSASANLAPEAAFARPAPRPPTSIVWINESA
jgi:hypothetical protein